MPLLGDLKKSDYFEGPGRRQDVAKAAASKGTTPSTAIASDVVYGGVAQW